MAIHSQHSNRDHAATAIRLETKGGGIPRKVAEQPLKSVDEVVKFEGAESASWTLTLTAGQSRMLVLRGLRFFDGDEEVCPHMVPYRDNAETLPLANADPLATNGPVTKDAPREPVASKRPVPDAAAEQEGRKSVREKFRTEFSKARKGDSKADLARALISHADQPDVEAIDYALFTEAIDLATQAGRLEIAFDAVQGLAGRFDINVLAMKERAAAKMIAGTMTPAEADLLLAKFFDLAGEAAAAEQYALAVKVMQSAGDAFRKPSVKALRDQTVAGGKQFASLRDAFEAAKSSRDLLKSNPENAAANFGWGRFLCFYRQEFDAGLPLLAKGNDKVYTSLAQRELSRPTSVDALLHLGDDWLKAGDKEKEPIKFCTRLRADQAWAAALASADPALRNDVEETLDSRIIKLFGSSFVATTGELAGATIPGTERLTPTDGFTIEFWVSTKALNGTLISKKHMVSDATILVHLDQGVTSLGIAKAGGGEGGSGGGSAINDGRWHHIAIVKQADQVTLFVDGKKITRAIEPLPLTSTSPWKFGCSYNRTPCAAHFGGVRISRVARYNDTFTPQRLNAKDRDTVFPL